MSVAAFSSGGRAKSPTDFLARLVGVMSLQAVFRKIPDRNRPNTQRTTVI